LALFFAFFLIVFLELEGKLSLSIPLLLFAIFFGPEQ
jgi:hypothetical protein